MGLTPEEAIRATLAARDGEATICPSEAARALDPAAWRDHMDSVRNAAAAMADRDEIEITQRGAVVDARIAQGPIRLRARTSS